MPRGPAKSPNIGRYVVFLRNLGQSCLEDRKQSARDLRTILEAGSFDAGFCFGGTSAKQPLARSIERYLRESRMAHPRYLSGSGFLSRRPIVGFNPLIYASECPAFRSANENPLAHFLRSGRPVGRWLHETIVPTRRATSEAVAGIRVALHGHFHYPELLPEFLECLKANQTSVDLFLTTTTKESANEIERCLTRFGMSGVKVIVTSNVGRDIAPLLKIFRNLKGAYDVIGHLHGKKSPQFAPEVGARWREFALRHLLGDTHPMADIILQRFADDPKLGVVFPEDPHLNDWDNNRPTSEAVANRMRIDLPLPRFFDFPIGAMFWARPQALQPMFDLNLSEQDFPAEPLPTDGTIVHALERLVTFSAEKAGYRYATTHVPGCWR
jgi:hypothetical protein